MLIEEFKKTGTWLFRWRSYLPLVLLVLAIPAVQASVSRPNHHLLHASWEVLCLAIAFSGLVVRILTVGYVPAGTSGRNTLRQVASSLNVTGMYAIVRHPIYLGNFLMWFGISLLPRCWWFTVITVLIFWLYYERIMFAEECFLLEQFGDWYRQWAARTPAFIPKFNNWVKPDLPFSLKSAVSREYSTFFTIIVMFTLFKVMVGWFSQGTLLLDLPTALLFSLGLLTYVTIRVLKKNTGLLRAEGR
jgi:protein-S-isoprenylcysteine O-methyltransferase Ste14